MLILYALFVACTPQHTTDSAIIQSVDPYFSGNDIQILDVYCSALQEERAQSVCFMPNRDGDYQYCHNVASDYGWTNQSADDDLLAFNSYLEAHVEGLSLSYSPINESLIPCFSAETELSFFDINSKYIDFYSDSIYHSAEYLGEGQWSGHAYLAINNDSCGSRIEELGWTQVEASLYGEPYQAYGETPVFRLEHKRSVSFDVLGL